MAAIARKKRILAKAIKLAGLVTKILESKALMKSEEHQEFLNLKSKTENLAVLLCQLSSTFSQMYKCPAYLIIDNTEQVLGKVLFRLLKCRAKCIIQHVFNTIPAALSMALKCGANGTMKPSVSTTVCGTQLRRMSVMIEDVIGNVRWLLQILKGTESDGCEYVGLPPIAADHPILCLIWEQIAILYSGTLEERSDSAASLLSLAEDGGDRFGKSIIKEGGVAPLLKLVEEGSKEGQEKAARAIGILGNEPESIQHIIHAGVCPVFAKILRQGPMKVRAVVAWAVSELVENYTKCQDLFAQHNVVYLLASHLSKTTEYEMKGMAARALWKLAKGNSPICRSILETKPLLYFAEFLEKGPDDLQSYSAMALMEITAVVDKDADLRRSASNLYSTDWKSVADQLLKIIEKADSGSHLLIPCINAIGNLARTFREPVTKMIGPLVRLLLDQRGLEITMEACIALTKFASTDNHFHLKYCKEIISFGVAKYLIEFVYFGERIVQVPALVLMCYIALHVPESEELSQAEVLAMLEWASKQSFMTYYEKDKTLGTLLKETKFRLLLNQCRGRVISHSVVTVISVSTTVNFV